MVLHETGEVRTFETIHDQIDHGDPWKAPWVSYDFKGNA